MTGVAGMTPARCPTLRWRTVRICGSSGGLALPTTASSPPQEGTADKRGGVLHNGPFPTAAVQGGAVVRLPGRRPGAHLDLRRSPRLTEAERGWRSPHRLIPSVPMAPLANMGASNAVDSIPTVTIGWLAGGVPVETLPATAVGTMKGPSRRFITPARAQHGIALFVLP